MRNHDLDYRTAGTAFTIYGLVDPRNGKYCYVGQTVDANRRLEAHLDPARLGGNIPLARWIQSLRDAQLAPLFEQLDSCTDQLTADAKEQEHIRRLNSQGHPLLNQTGGGTNARGSSKTALARKRDWIELGYILKSAREATLLAQGQLFKIQPKTSREAKVLTKAVEALTTALCSLDDKVRSLYRDDDAFKGVFMGSANEHFDRLKPPHRDE